MFRTRFWMLITVLVLTLVPLLATAGYGLYLRSGWYANSVAQQTGAFLGAPVEIGSIMPLDRTSQGFRDVTVWLPGEFNPIFTCRLAIVRLVDGKSIELELRDGRVEARTDAWDRGTLGKLFATAFAHDFQKIRLRTVHLTNMELVLRRGRAMVWASGATGQVDLAGTTAKMNVICDGLNGVRSGEPIRLQGEFEPGAVPQVREMSLSVQRLGVEAFLPAKVRPAARQGAAPQSQPVFGWFTGNIVYRGKAQADAADVVELGGTLREIDLGAISRQIGTGGLQGMVSGTLDKAVLADGQIQSVQGRLRIEGLDLKGLFGLMEWPRATGTASLELHELRYAAGRLEALLAEGQVAGLEIGPLLAPLRIGTITGLLNAKVQKIKIVDGQVAELAGEARIVAPEGVAGTIDRSILEAAARRFLDISLPPVLPWKVPYSAFGARFHAEENELYVQGVAGLDDAFLLVADVASVSMPLVPQPPVPIRLEEWRGPIEEQIARLVRAAAGWAREKMSPE